MARSRIAEGVARHMSQASTSAVRGTGPIVFTPHSLSIPLITSSLTDPSYGYSSQNDNSEPQKAMRLRKLKGVSGMKEHGHDIGP
jgi:hypothetical protein